jgi:hypothetical protein
MYTHILCKNAYTNDITFSEIQCIADAEYYEYNRITVVVYFVGNMQPLWESLDYIIANGVKRPFQTNPSVFKIKQSGPDTSILAQSENQDVSKTSKSIQVDPTHEGVNTSTSITVDPTHEGVNTSTSIPVDPTTQNPNGIVVLPKPTVVVVDDGQSVFRPQCSVS